MAMMLLQCRPVELPSLKDESQWVEGCVTLERAFVTENIDLYYNTYYCFRLVFIHLVPCCALVVLNALLVLTIRQAQKRRRQLLAQNRKSESRRLAESTVTTMMLVAVVGVFLLVEFPLAILVIVLMADNTFDLDLMDARRRDTLEQLINMFILLSYPINFFIYCGMSQQFRDTFCGLFGRGCCGAGVSPPADTIVELTSPPQPNRVDHDADAEKLTYIKMVPNNMAPDAHGTDAVAKDAV